VEVTQVTKLVETQATLEATAQVEMEQAPMAQTNLDK
jgi:hypothetical protein